VQSSSHFGQRSAVSRCEDISQVKYLMASKCDSIATSNGDGPSVNDLANVLPWREFASSAGFTTRVAGCRGGRTGS
jgi:hypothetical protein